MSATGPADVAISSAIFSCLSNSLAEGEAADPTPIAAPVVVLAGAAGAAARCCLGQRQRRGASQRRPWHPKRRRLPPRRRRQSRRQSRLAQRLVASLRHRSGLHAPSVRFRQASPRQASPPDPWLPRRPCSNVQILCGAALAPRWPAADPPCCAPRRPPRRQRRPLQAWGAGGGATRERRRGRSGRRRGRWAREGAAQRTG